MEYLVLGVLIFFAMHFIPSTSLRTSMVASLGEKRFKGLFSLVAAVGLGLIIYGFSEAEYSHLWTPPTWGRVLLISTMPIVVILWVASELPNNIKRVVRHPMLIAMIIWGMGHLIANGDLASTILFASFVAFSAFNIVSVNARDGYQPPASVSRGKDILVIAIGLAIYGLLYYFHGVITGMPLL